MKYWCLENSSSSVRRLLLETNDCRENLLETQHFPWISWISGFDDSCWDSTQQQQGFLKNLKKTCFSVPEFQFFTVCGHCGSPTGSVHDYYY